jgi:hypothetical protein
VDDIVAGHLGNPFNPFLGHLNGLEPTITLAVERELNGMSPCLDVLVEIIDVISSNKVKVKCKLVTLL